MSIQSWMIKSWATVEWYLPTEEVERHGFWHVNTQIRDQSDSSGLRSGETVWAAQADIGQVGMAWEWVEVRPGVVMLADPNSVITNLQLVDSKRTAVVGLSKTVAVNRLVHALPWQSAVCEMLRADQATSATQEQKDVLTSQLPAQALLASDTANPAAGGNRALEVISPALYAPPSLLEKPAVRSFQERRQNHTGHGRARASDREEGRATAGTEHLRKAA